MKVRKKARIRIRKKTRVKPNKIKKDSSYECKISVSCIH